MRHSDRCGFRDPGTSDRGILEVDRADPLPARLDDILGAVGDLDRAVRMNGGNVTGIEPLLLVNAFAVLLEVATHDRRAPRLEPTGADPVAGKNPAFRIERSKL